MPDPKMYFVSRVCAAGPTRGVGGSAASTGPWRRGVRRSMATWQWSTKGWTTTPTTTTPPSNCTTLRYSRAPLQEHVSQQETAYQGENIQFVNKERRRGE